MAIYGYIRVSTIMQAEEGESLDVQQRKLEGWAMMEGEGLKKVFVERGVSGSKPLGMRAEGAKLLEALKPGDTVVAAKLDRAFRNAYDALGILKDFKKEGIKLVLLDLGGDVTSDNVSGLIFKVLAAVADFERDRIAERISEVKTDQRKRGRYLGGAVPYGYSVEDGDLVECKKRHRNLSKIFDLRDDGKSLHQIHASLKGDLSVSAISRTLSRGRDHVLFLASDS